VNFSTTKTKSIEPPSALSMRLWIVFIVLVALFLAVNILLVVNYAESANSWYSYGEWSEFFARLYRHFFLTIFLFGFLITTATWAMFYKIRRDAPRVVAIFVLILAPLLIGLFWMLSYA